MQTGCDSHGLYRRPLLSAASRASTKSVLLVMSTSLRQRGDNAPTTASVSSRPQPQAAPPDEARTLNPDLGCHAPRLRSTALQRCGAPAAPQPPIPGGTDDAKRPVMPSVCSGGVDVGSDTGECFMHQVDIVAYFVVAVGAPQSQHVNHQVV